jgi:hypothetical protein
MLASTEFRHGHLKQGDFAIKDSLPRFYWTHQERIFEDFIERVKAYIPEKYGVEADLTNPYWAAANVAEYIRDNYNYPAPPASEDGSGDSRGNVVDNAHFHVANGPAVYKMIMTDPRFATDIHGRRSGCMAAGGVFLAVMRYMGFPARWIGTSIQRSTVPEQPHANGIFYDLNEDGMFNGDDHMNIIHGHYTNEVYLGPGYGWQRFDATPKKPDDFDGDGLDYDDFAHLHSRDSQYELMKRKVTSGHNPSAVASSIGVGYNEHFFYHAREKLTDCAETSVYHESTGVYTSACKGSQAYEFIFQHEYPGKVGGRNGIRWRPCLTFDVVVNDGNPVVGENTIEFVAQGPWALFEPDATVEIVLRVNRNGILTHKILKSGIPWNRGRERFVIPEGTYGESMHVQVRKSGPEEFIGGASPKFSLPAPSPRELWNRCSRSLPPFSYDILQDEVVPSDTDPHLNFRRLKIRFISQTINGKAMGHDAVVFIPADPAVNSSLHRRGKVVVVARPFSDDTLIRNCAEPIAARTGYPTMCIVLPGDQDGRNGEMPWLTGLRGLARETGDPMNHDLFRCAVPYLRALDVFSDLLKEKEIRAVIGGHSKRAYYAYTAAAIDPERIVSVVYMGCERLFSEEEKYPDFSTSPPFADGEKYPKPLVLFSSQKHVKCPVLYLGATNEAGFTMFNINELVDRMEREWTIEYIPNYRHAFDSEKQFTGWRMWVSHVFDGRPLTRIGNCAADHAGGGTLVSAHIESPNKILQVKAWYVYCDDVPYWRDLMWYPVLMRRREGNSYVARIGGRRPDAWFVEVKDIANGIPGYVSNLPENLTETPAAERNARRPRYWKPEQGDNP